MLSRPDFQPAHAHQLQSFSRNVRRNRCKGLANFIVIIFLFSPVRVIERLFARFRLTRRRLFRSIALSIRIDSSVSEVSSPLPLFLTGAFFFFRGEGVGGESDLDISYETFISRGRPTPIVLLLETIRYFHLWLVWEQVHESFLSKVRSFSSFLCVVDYVSLVTILSIAGRRYTVSLS